MGISNIHSKKPPKPQSDLTFIHLQNYNMGQCLTCLPGCGCTMGCGAKGAKNKMRESGASTDALMLRTQKRRLKCCKAKGKIGKNGETAEASDDMAVSDSKMPQRQTMSNENA